MIGGADIRGIHISSRGRRAQKVSPDHVNRKLRNAAIKTGLNKTVTCHTLRHSFASNLAASNVNIVVIQKLLGHSNLSTTSIYTHTNLADMADAVNKINGKE